LAEATGLGAGTAHAHITATSSGNVLVDASIAVVVRSITALVTGLDVLIANKISGHTGLGAR
jgi:hypothetical protein